VDDGAIASLSMQQPLVEEINPMNHATTDGPASRESYILFRHGSLLPRITNPRSSPPSKNLFVKRWAPVTNLYRYKGPTSLFIHLLVNRKNKEDLIESP